MEGPHSEEENTKKLGLGSGDISNYTAPREGGGANPVGRLSRSSKADYAGMTSHFSLHEYIEEGEEGDRRGAKNGC